MKNWKVLLIVFFLIGSFLRLWQIDRYPVGFTPDEAAQGYTAYSILKTGRDEWGTKFSLNLRSFGDFKPPLQTYLMIPSVAVFGLNEFAVRLPNALISSFAPLGVFLMTYLIFGNLPIAIISFLLLTFSPWHISLSRGAFEANLAVTLIPYGIYSLLKSWKGKAIVWQIAASILLGLSLFSYHSAKIITPLVILVIFGYKVLIDQLFLSWRGVKSIITKEGYFLAIFLTFLIIAFSSFSSGGQKRGLGIAVFNPTDKWKAVNDERWFATQSNVPDLLSRFFHNKISYSLSKFSENFASYFSPQFFVIDGAGEGSYGMVPGQGVIWWWEIPIIIFGLLRFAKKPSKEVVIILILIFLAPIPASLAKGIRSANRVAIMMPWIQIFSAWSTYQLVSVYRSRWIRVLIPLVAVLFFAFFLEAYFVQSPRVVAKDMLFGRCEAVRYAASFENQTDAIVVSRKLSEPQAYVMFCNQFSPKLAQQETPAWKAYETRDLQFVDQMGEYKLGKYNFREISNNDDRKKENQILIGLPEEFLWNKGADKVIKYPDGSDAIYVFKTPKISDL